MDKYTSTLLPQDDTKEENQKATLDLLAKINDTITNINSIDSRVTQNTTNIATNTADIVTLQSNSRYGGIYDYGGDAVSRWIMYNNGWMRQHGWYYISTPGGSTGYTTTLTFPRAFLSTEYDAIAMAIGTKSTGVPTTRVDTTGILSVFCCGRILTAQTISIQVQAGGVFGGANNHALFSWTAEGLWK